MTENGPLRTSDLAQALDTRTVTALAKLRTGSDGVGLVQKEVPAPRSGQALVRVRAAGVCGTDLHIQDDEYASAPPVTMGHEIAGVVEAVGDELDSSWVGRRVAVETYFSTCGKCVQCRAGRGNLCADRKSIGSFRDGGFADFMLIPVINLHEIPDTVDIHAAALTEPLACVCHCLLDPAIVNTGDRVLVTGPGAMGLLSAQVARASGGRVVISGLESDRPRLDIAEGLGISTTTQVPEVEAFDVVIECSGSAGGANAALRAAKRYGNYVSVGIFGRAVSIDFDTVLYKELTVTSGFASTPKSWDRAVELLRQGDVSLDVLVGRVVSLHEWEEVFEALRRGQGLKSVFDPTLRP
ncbi:alcohol dehydrogenase catalytic domain-containing protein [Rhodococcus sp. 114MFTsu3.1]|jgi:L-iditol 2-dehydrogenase|uniref:alcohol dehydrogenase catalytic domain-containing protein n=1 Tax=Rhodococcus sp. 114MFTsu3.1 TaxID=1172184 RepID=UPI0012DF8429|nr:alcohol dehydrogenase catalytic domain-containing protein [Rhodococcus sp. 114MFTsu3.1]